MRILLFAVALLITTCGWAKKVQWGIDAVILSADLIVLGEITLVTDSSYQFRVDQYLSDRPAGTSDTMGNRITVCIWQEWTCDQRDFKIAPGQRLVLLLDKNGTRYHTINDSTGEIPVVNDSLTLRNERERDERGEPYGFLMPVQEFIQGVLDLRMCSRLSGFIQGEYTIVNDQFWACPPEQRREHASVNAFTAWLYDRVERRGKAK